MDDGSKAKRFGSQLGLVVVTCLVAGSLLGGRPVGAFNVPNNSVTSAKIVDGAVRGADLRPGAVGAKHLSGMVRPMWAKVGVGLASGEMELIRGRGAIGASDRVRVPPGYVVEFTRPVNRCGWTATANNNGAGAGPPVFLTIGENPLTSARNDLEIHVLGEGTGGDYVRWLELNPGNGFTVVVHC